MLQISSKELCTGVEIVASSIRGSKPLLCVVRNASEAKTAAKAKQELDGVKEELHQEGRWQHPPR